MYPGNEEIKINSSLDNYKLTNEVDDVDRPLAPQPDPVQLPSIRDLAEPDHQVDEGAGEGGDDEEEEESQEMVSGQGSLDCQGYLDVEETAGGHNGQRVGQTGGEVDQAGPQRDGLLGVELPGQVLAQTEGGQLGH